MNKMITREEIEKIDLPEETKTRLLAQADETARMEQEIQQLKEQGKGKSNGSARKPKEMADRLKRVHQAVQDGKLPARQRGTVAFIVSEVEVKSAFVEVIGRDVTQDDLEKLGGLYMWAYTQRETKEKALQLAAAEGDASAIFDEDD